MLFQSESNISGFGLWTDRFIKKGEKIHQFTGKVVSSAHLESNYSPSEANYAIQFHKNWYLAPTDNLDSFANHCCRPNSGIKVHDFDQVCLYALYDISAMSEITFDYSTTQTDSWSLPCACGAEGCRKVIEQASYLSIDLAFKYWVKGVMPNYTFFSSLFSVFV